MPVDLLNAYAWGVDKHTVVLGAGVQPLVVSAVATSTDRVRVTFDRPMDEYSIGTFWHYGVTKVVGGARLHVVGALAVSTTEVDLITELQETVNYEVKVTGAVFDSAFGTIIDPANNTAQFLGVNPDSTYLDATAFNLRNWYGLQAGMQGDPQTAFIQDTLPPEINNEVPSPSAVGEFETVVVTFDLEDVPPPSVPAGIDLSTVQIFVEGALAYQGSTDTFIAPYNGGSSARVGIPTGHSFAIQKTSNWSSFKQIQIRVVASDLAPLPNVLDTTWQFRVRDYLNPTMDTNAPTGVGVLEQVLITFSTKDEATGSGVDQNTINVTVDAVNAIVNGVFQTNFDGAGSQIVPNAFNGYDVTIDRVDNHPSSATVVVVANCDDGEGNAATPLGWNFTVTDHAGPLVTPIDPTVSQVGVDIDKTITITVGDDDQIIPNSVQVEIDRGEGAGWELAFDEDGAPQFKPGWDGAGSFVSIVLGVYTIAIDPLVDFAFGTTVMVRTTAVDPPGNPERLP